MESTQKIIIGIDTGVNTGIAIWNITEQKFLLIQTVTIDQAFNLVKFQQPALVRYEDARLRKWFGNSGREALQGAGSVKRDAKAWEDFLKNNAIRGEPVAPKDNDTKNTSDEFKRKTGWLKPTNEHGRDAANLVWKFSEMNLRNTFKVLGISQAAEAVK